LREGKLPRGMCGSENEEGKEKRENYTMGSLKTLFTTVTQQ